MSVNIIDLIKGQFGPAVISQVAGQLGESESGVSKAISSFIPTILGGMVSQSEHSNLLKGVTDLASSGVMSNLSLDSVKGNSMLTGLLSMIFGDKVNTIVSSIATFAGIKESSADYLFGFTSMSSLATVGKYAKDHNLDAEGLKNLLDGQKTNISNLLPAGLSLGAIGLGSLGNFFGEAKEKVADLASNATEKISETVSDLKGSVSGVAAGASEKISNATSAVASGVSDKMHDLKDEAGKVGAMLTGNEKKEGVSLWKWLMPLALLLLAGWFVWKQCDKKNTAHKDTPLVTDTVNHHDNKTADEANADNNAVTEIDLNGVVLKGKANGMEARMMAFLKSGEYDNQSDDQLKETWYDFDNVQFKMGSSTELEAGSETQIQNLAQILKAFPSAKVKIGGYTDKTGNEESNKKLSQTRADFIKAELEKLGIGSQVEGAEGYGSEFATVDASASNDERAKDRKMAVRFAK